MEFQLKIHPTFHIFFMLSMENAENQYLCIRTISYFDRPIESSHTRIDSRNEIRSSYTVEKTSFYYRPFRKNWTKTKKDIIPLDIICMYIGVCKFVARIKLQCAFPDRIRFARPRLISLGIYGFYWYISIHGYGCTAFCF